MEEDLNNLRTLYRDEGFLDVSIEQQMIKLIPEGKSSMELAINISEGERSYFGEVTIVGNSVISTEELMELDEHVETEKSKREIHTPHSTF